MAVLVVVYGVASVVFMVGVGLYYLRWRKPPETVTETVVETKIIQAPPSHTVILCRECKHSMMDSRFGYRCAETGCQTAPEAFCSKAEKRIPDAYALSNLSEAEKMDVMKRVYQGERILL